jgi:hypothetical protein
MGKTCLIRPRRSASSKFRRPELDATTATSDDVLLPLDTGAHIGTFAKSESLERRDDML